MVIAFRPLTSAVQGLEVTFIVDFFSFVLGFLDLLLPFPVICISEVRFMNFGNRNTFCLGLSARLVAGLREPEMIQLSSLAHV